MSTKQIEELRQSLFIDDLNLIESAKLWTKEQKQLDIELDCREMIMSCLIYGTHFMTSHYKDRYMNELGISRVQDLYIEQYNYFNTCQVLHNVHTDSEGCTYNSLIEP